MDSDGLQIVKALQNVLLLMGKAKYYRLDGNMQKEKATEELLNQVNSIRKERELQEASAKSKENTTKLKTETNLQKYKDDIKKLEIQISQLRLKTDSSKIAALKRGVDGSYANRLADVTNFPKDSKCLLSMELWRNSRNIRNRLCETLKGVRGVSIRGDVRGFPSLCSSGGLLHEKKGMKDALLVGAPSSGVFLYVLLARSLFLDLSPMC
ncbi:hypothetical protein RHSIM_Rhsim04G0212600 [Rhododendron simsii]|uniref:Uncharacterized protein n=1 Tax=Rhododendron simsii TaxID=118357 RepID=A0A834LRS2_RHOSS|nr:hypothetical protein RHSIM_Rhsim04G0212600 [Rhododendron simsii]